MRRRDCHRGRRNLGLVLRASTDRRPSLSQGGAHPMNFDAAAKHAVKATRLIFWGAKLLMRPSFNESLWGQRKRAVKWNPRNGLRRSSIFVHLRWIQGAQEGKASAYQAAGEALERSNKDEVPTKVGLREPEFDTRIAAVTRIAIIRR